MSLRQQEIAVQDHIAQHYEHTRYKVHWSKQYHDWLFGCMIDMVKPHGHILDAGCGNGLLAEYLPEEKIWGIDISHEMIKHAKKRLWDARVGDVEDLPYESNFFDTVFARAILHHLIDPEQGLQELVRVLKPGGRIIFMDTRNQNVFSKVFRKIMNRTEHFSDAHRNMEEGQYFAMLKRHIEVEKKLRIGFIAYTLLGFPDVFNGYRFVPFKFIFTPLLIWIDRVWMHIPVLNRLALGILVVGKKPRA